MGLRGGGRVASCQVHWNQVLSGVYVTDWISGCDVYGPGRR